VRGAARRNGPTKRRDRAAGRLHHDRVGRTSARNAAEFKNKVIGTLRRLQNKTHIIRAFFADPELRYITA
jgi:hypothetical protein